MKAGRVIDGDEHDARTLAQKLVDEARQDADKLETARNEATQVRNDVQALAASILADARAEAERVASRAAAEAARLRDDAKVLANSSRRRDARDRAGRGARRTDCRPGRRGRRARRARDGAGRRARRGRARSIGAAREPLAAEVVGFRGEQAVLLPLGDLAGVAPAGAVWRTGDAAGDPLRRRSARPRARWHRRSRSTAARALTGERWAVDRPAPPPLARPPITRAAADRRARDRYDADARSRPARRAVRGGRRRQVDAARPDRARRRPPT